MLRPLMRIGKGGLSALKKEDSGYFKGKAGGRSHFRDDIRLIAGGALAAAFVASAFTGHIEIPYVSDAAVTVVAAAAGGIGAKYLLV